MKKIITMVAVAALVGSAFAADPAITMNYRSRMNFVKTSAKTVESEGAAKTTTTKDNTFTWLDQDGYGAPEDSFGFKANGENFGVQIQFNANVLGISNTVKGVKSTDEKTTMKDFSINMGPLAKLNTYNAWMKFGELKLSAGAWRDGYADGNYRVKKDVDAASLEGTEFEAVKLGGVFKSVQTAFIDDMSNLKGSGPTLSFFAEYPVKIGDDITINLLAGILNNKVDEYDEKDVSGDTTTTTKWSIESSPVARIQFNMKDVLNSEVIWKNAGWGSHAIGLYFMPKMVKGLDLNIGGALSLAPKDTYKDGKKVSSVREKDIGIEVWEIDLRARYQINKQFSITTFNQLAAVGDVYDVLNTKGEVTHRTGAELAAKTYASGNTKNNQMAMWNEIAARYTVNDTLAVGLTAGLVTGLKPAQSAKDKDVYKTSLAYNVTPFVQLFAAKGAFVNIGFSFSGSTYVVENAAKKNDTTSYFNFQVPVVFRVKM